MNTKFIAVAFMTGALLGPTIGFADDTDSDRSHPGHFIKDSAITVAIKTKLAADHVNSLAHIKVDTDKDGVVYLSGAARTKAAAERAVEIARSTDGVVRVKNDIIVKADL